MLSADNLLQKLLPSVRTMTEDIDPQWHFADSTRASSNNNERAFHIPVEKSTGALRSISRTPAAIAGIALVCAVGFLALRGWDALPAQVTDSASSSSSESGTILRLTNSGIDPTSINVQVGDTIIFVNETSSPHILKSDSIKDADGNALYTPAIFENARYSFVIGEQPAGIYTFASIIDNTLTGTIIITTTNAAAFTSSRQSGTTSSNGCAQPLGSTDGVDLPPGKCELDGTNGSQSFTIGSNSDGTFSGTNGSASDTSNGGNGNGVDGNNLGNSSGNGTTTTENSNTGQNGNSGSFGDNGTNNDGNRGSQNNQGGNTIPTNPFAIGNGNTQNNTFGSAESANVQTSSRAQSQPESGPAVWVAIALSIGAMVILQRKQFVG